MKSYERDTWLMSWLNQLLIGASRTVMSLIPLWARAKVFGAKENSCTGVKRMGGLGPREGFGSKEV